MNAGVCPFESSDLLVPVLLVFHHVYLRDGRVFSLSTRCWFLLKTMATLFLPRQWHSILANYAFWQTAAYIGFSDSNGG